jgi:hypothetical protein
MEYILFMQQYEIGISDLALAVLCHAHTLRTYLDFGKLYYSPSQSGLEPIHVLVIKLCPVLRVRKVAIRVSCTIQHYGNGVAVWIFSAVPNVVQPAPLCHYVQPVNMKLVVPHNYIGRILVVPSLLNAGLQLVTPGTLRKSTGLDKFDVRVLILNVPIEGGSSCIDLGVQLCLQI